MKNIITITLLIIPILCIGQKGNQRLVQGEILDKRATYVALRLNLSMEQSVLFKEKYIEYEDRRKEIRRSFERQKTRATTEAQAEQQILARFKMEDDLVAAKRLFYQQLKGNISSLKLTQLPVAEEEFKEILVQRIKQNRRGG